MKKSIEIISAAALLLAGVVSCQKTEIVEQIENKPAIEFVKAENSEIAIPAGSSEAVTVEIKSMFKTAELVIEAGKDSEWCTAAFKGENAIVITPSAEGLLEEKTATFTVKAAGETKATETKIIYQPSEVKFTVKRAAATLEGKPAIIFNESEDGKFVIEAGKADVMNVGFKTDFKVEELVISQKSGEDWVSASFGEGNIIKITPKAEFLDADKTAEFVVEKAADKTKGAVIYTPDPVKFTVSREKIVYEPKPVMEFVYADDVNIWLNEGQTTSRTVEVICNFPWEQINIREKEGKTWCEAILERTNTLRINPTEEGLDREMTATFVVEYTPKTKAVIYEPQAVEFTVIREAEGPKLDITGEGVPTEGKYRNMDMPFEGGDIIVTVHTNAPKWYINDSYNGGLISFDKMEGVDGDQVTLTLWPNYMSDSKNGTIIFSMEKDGTDGVWLSVNQNGKPANPATGVTVKRFGFPIQTNAEIAIVAAGGDENSVKLSITPTPEDGELDFLFYKRGTNEIDPDAENIVNLGMVWDGTANTHKLVPVANTTGEIRQTDLVIVGKGTTEELFRLRINQSAN